VTWVESQQGRRTMFAARTMKTVESLKYKREKRRALGMFLNVNNVDAERMSTGRLFQATEPATENAVGEVKAFKGLWCTRTQSWTWIGSIHGLDWMGLGQDFEETLWIGFGPMTAIVCFF